jgi:hypothetical protein
LVFLVAAACSPVPAGEIAGERMEGGAAINSIAAPLGKSVVLVLSPAQCVSCDVDLARWLSPGRDTTTRVSVVLTREPTAEEQRSIALLRLPVAGHIAKTVGRRVPSPCILRFDDGQPVSSTCDP